jgi:hypothetical protein
MFTGSLKSFRDHLAGPTITSQPSVLSASRMFDIDQILTPLNHSEVII